MIRDALTSQSINFSDDFNFLYPNFFVDHSTVQKNALRILVTVWPVVMYVYLIVRSVVKWREFRGNKKIARQLWSAMQDSRNAVNLSRAGKTAVFLNLFARISERIWTVVSRAYFSNASSHSENVASARSVKLRLLLVKKNKRRNLRVLFNLYSVPRDNNWAESETKSYF